MDNFKLKVPEELSWRTLECRSLQPEEECDRMPLSPEDLQQLFDVPKAAGEDAEQIDHSEGENEEIEANEVAMEAANMAPDIPADQGDGADFDEATQGPIVEQISDFMEGLQPDGAFSSFLKGFNLAKTRR